MNCKYKSSMTKKRAFTLIELLIVIAIIGILFIVLVSKVDFATDKAKATGVQTAFRSFQMAFETVSKEKAGFNSFGWNTGDANANGVRDSVDEGDANADGVYQDGETWTGHKKYLEDWTEKYSLIKPGTTFEANGYDKDAIFALETAINKNLDPKLHITIDAKTGLVTMANGAQDPWNTQYHGAYISAEDGMDRGAIVMYSNGTNQKFGSEHDIANGVPTVIVPGNNKNGADDYSMVVVYTYTNGYGEVSNLTTGFSNNQNFLIGNSGSVNAADGGSNVPVSRQAGLYKTNGDFLSWNELINSGILRISSGGLASRYDQANDIQDVELINTLTGELIVPANAGIDALCLYVFDGCNGLTNLVLPEGIELISCCSFCNCRSLTSISLPSTIKTIDMMAFGNCTSLTTIKFAGTIEQWNNITNYCGWYDVPATYVECSDGQVLLNK